MGERRRGLHVRGAQCRGRRGLALLVRVEDAVLRLHSHMARVPAVCEAFLIGRELLRRSIVVEHRVSPPAGFRESLAVLFHDKSLLEDVWHIYGELSVLAFFRLPL